MSERLPITDDEVISMFPGLTDAPVTNDNRIVNDPTGQLPQSAKGRKPARNDPANDLRTRDLERMIRDHVLTGADPGEALDQFGEVLNRMRREYAGTRMALVPHPDGSGRLEDDGAGRAGEEEGYDRNADVKDSTRRTILRVLDGLDKVTGSAPKELRDQRKRFGVVSRDVVAEARTLLRIICDNLAGARKRNAGDDEDASDAVGNTEAAYKEASPAFSAMSLSRPQSDAEAERIVDQMFERKFYRHDAK